VGSARAEGQLSGIECEAHRRDGSDDARCILRADEEIDVLGGSRESVDSHGEPAAKRVLDALSGERIHEPTEFDVQVHPQGLCHEGPHVGSATVRTEAGPHSKSLRGLMQPSWTWQGGKALRAPGST
jgi:hypothetical protein